MQRMRQWVISAVVAFVRVYQVTLRPLWAGSCRYVPGCSEYFIEAVRTHGPLRGSWLGVKRIMRCRPGGGWGYDPVPPACSERVEQ